MDKKRETGWFWTLLPSNAAVGGVGTLIPLYIVSPAVGGTVVEVGAALSAYNLALIPAALAWGMAVDSLGRRRPIIILSYAGMTALLGLMYTTDSLGALILEYAIFGFLAAGPGPVVSLLLMETTPKASWARMFARLSSISMVGLMMGSLPGIFWTGLFDLKSYFLLCSFYGLLALVMALRWVPEPPITLERRALIHSAESLAHRLLHLPLIFLKPPTLTDFRRFWRLLRGLTSELPLLYFFTLFFFMSGSTFFTSYTPFLVSRGVSESQTFLAYFLLSLINTLTFIWAGTVVPRVGEGRSAKLAVAMRVLAMLGTAVLALRLEGVSLLIATIFMFAVIGASFSLANTATSTLLFRTLGTSHQGELLGVYSALTAAGLFAGAFLSGNLSHHFGFPLTFLTAGLLLIIALTILHHFTRMAHTNPS
jgi:MFS family permease